MRINLLKITEFLADRVPATLLAPQQSFRNPLSQQARARAPASRIDSIQPETQIGSASGAGSGSLRNTFCTGAKYSGIRGKGRRRGGGPNRALCPRSRGSFGSNGGQRRLFKTPRRLRFEAAPIQCFERPPLGDLEARFDNHGDWLSWSCEGFPFGKTHSERQVKAQKAPKWS